jgi:hypothetical protein
MGCALHLGVEPLSNYPGRIPCNDGVGRYVRSHDGSGSYEGTLANVDPTEHDTTGSEPHVVFNRHHVSVGRFSIADPCGAAKGYSDLIAGVIVSTNNLHTGS